MRIQHNIMAMNAYRNYTNNVSAMKANLEKLSSGYKINRAGDDAAGLAISEKMRAQITGLKTAQKNAKDGISLVQTAEGALTEVHDMLNRMVELATMSANGTYDNTTDRAQLQKEMDQLNAEINRIADSANFNGIKLLDGSMDAEVQVSETKNFSAYTGGNGSGGIAAGGSTDDTVNGAGEVLLHKEPTGTAKTSFSVELTDKKVQLDDNGQVSLSLATKAALGDEDPQLVLTYKGSKDQVLTGEMLAEELAKSATDGKVTLNVGKDGGVGVEYEVTAKDGVLTFTMTDAGLKAAQGAIATDPENTGVFQGNFTWGLWNSTTTAGTPADEEAGTPATPDTVTQGTEVTNLGSLGNNNYGTTVHNVGSDSSVKQLARAGVDLTESIADGGGVKIGDTTYIWAMTDKTLNATYGNNTKVIDIRDLCENGELKTTLPTGKEGDATATQRAISRFTEAANDNSMFRAEYALGDEIVYFTERESNTNTDVLTTFKGVKSQIQMIDPAKTSVKGSALTLQIGDTADSYNQLKVSVADMHAAALGLDKIKINDQASAAEAVDVIKAAINKVSDVRGTLGATQNRLDHTINNLSVMTENIQDAESTIRDVDIAEEMMAYTKNNILIQSAQAMLAQANQVPQGVLQLLQ